MIDLKELKNLLKIFDTSILLGVVFVLFATWLLDKTTQQALPWLAEKVSARYRLVILALAPVVRLLIIFCTITIIIPMIIDPSFENLIALLGAVGLAVGFAFKDYISSLIAGIVTLFETPYHPGDWIEIEGVYGEVRRIGMRAVEILTPDDTVVIIPHLKLWDKPVFNSNKGSRNLMCVADFYIDPKHDAEQVKKTLHDVGLTSVYLQLNQPIGLTVREKPWGTHYRLKAYPCDPRDQFEFITDLTIRGKAALVDLGVDFVSMPMGQAVTLFDS